MKKFVVGILTVVLVFTIGTTIAFASGTGQRRGCGFTDRDGDRICDYAGPDCGYIDENEDGVCDHYENRVRPQGGRGYGCGRGNGYGRGCGR